LNPNDVVTLKIKVAGDQSKGAPNVEIYLGNQAVLSKSVPESFAAGESQIITVTAKASDLLKAGQTITARYTNDTADGTVQQGLDRNLRILDTQIVLPSGKTVEYDMAKATLTNQGVVTKGTEGNSILFQQDATLVWKTSDFGLSLKPASSTPAAPAAPALAPTDTIVAALETPAPTTPAPTAPAAIAPVPAPTAPTDVIVAALETPAAPTVPVAATPTPAPTAPQLSLQDAIINSVARFEDVDGGNAVMSSDDPQTAKIQLALDNLSLYFGDQNKVLLTSGYSESDISKLVDTLSAPTA
jgi:hypothetical protein